MARISKAKVLADLHNKYLKEFDLIYSASKEQRDQAVKDRRFYSIPGAQWEGPESELFGSTPKFEMNKIHLAVIRIFSEYRNNRITVDFIPKTTENDDLADTLDGLYRADEIDSSSEEAYDNCFEEGVGGGMGAIRLRACLEDEFSDDEHQRIRIEPVYDADSSVYYDLDAKRYDKSDAKCCYVITSMSVEAYKDKYNDDPTSWPKSTDTISYDWNTPDVVYIAERYGVEIKSEEYRVFRMIDGTTEEYDQDDFEEDEALYESLMAVGAEEVGTKIKKERYIRKYVMSGGKILEDCGYIAGHHIPIVPFYGKRWFVDNIERFMGHVRLAVDAQRLKNMQISKLGEISALSTVEKPILTPEQILGHSVMWSEDNTKNYPYLLINPVRNEQGQVVLSGPVAYTRPPSIPPAMAALLQLTEVDMQDLLGNQKEGERIAANISDKAISLVQAQLGLQTYIYMSNFAKTIRRCGEVWLSMAKDVYVEEGRRMKTVGLSGNTGYIDIMKPMMKDGELKYLNDFSQSKMDVVVDVGPASNSKREAALRNFLSMLSVTQDPETATVLNSLIMMNMDGEGITEVREYFRRRLVLMGVVKPNEKEQEELAASQGKPDATQLYLTAAAEAEQAKAAESRAQTTKTVAEADKARAQTLEILSKIEAANVIPLEEIGAATMINRGGKMYNARRLMESANQKVNRYQDVAGML